MLVQEKQCDQCLFSPNKLVDQKRKDQIIKETLEKDTFFICHKVETIERYRGRGMQVCCRGFWDKYKHRFYLGRLFQRLNAVRFVSIK